MHVNLLFGSQNQNMNPNRGTLIALEAIETDHPSHINRVHFSGLETRSNVLIVDVMGINGMSSLGVGLCCTDQCAGQFMGLRAKVCGSQVTVNMCSL